MEDINEKIRFQGGRMYILVKSNQKMKIKYEQNIDEKKRKIKKSEVSVKREKIETKSVGKK